MIAHADPRILCTRPVHLRPLSELDRQAEALLRTRHKVRWSKVLRILRRLSPRRTRCAMDASASLI